MNVASLDLCKELYELSGWGWDDDECGDTQTYGWSKKAKGYVLNHAPAEDYVKPAFIPAYDLGYLIRRLPPKFTKRVNHYLELSPCRAGRWRAMYTWESAPAAQYADTPEDALCKLAIELFKHGVLSNPQEQTE